MHKAAKRPIEVWRVNFSDVLSSPYGPTQHTRAATRQATSMGTTDLESNPGSDSRSGPATQEPIISDDPRNLVVPRRSE